MTQLQHRWGAQQHYEAHLGICLLPPGVPLRHRHLDRQQWLEHQGMNWNYQVHLRYLLGLQELLVQWALLAQGVHMKMKLNVWEITLQGGLLG